MRRTSTWLPAVFALVGIALFVIGFVVGWETIEPVAIEGLTALPGAEGATGAFGGIVSSGWGLEVSWAGWISGLVVVGMIVAVVWFRSVGRAVAAVGLVIVGLWMGWSLLSLPFESIDSDTGVGLSPWGLGMSILGAALTIVAGVIPLVSLLRRTPSE